MFEKNHRPYIKIISLSLMVTGLIWLASLLFTAIAAEKSPPLPHTDHVTLGPLVLGEIIRTELAEGIAVTFSFKIGTFILLLLGIAMGVIISVTTRRQARMSSAHGAE